MKYVVRIIVLLLALLLALPVVALADVVDAPVYEVEEFVIGEEAAPESAEETVVVAPEAAGDEVSMGMEPMAIGQINLVNVKDNGEITLAVGETRQIVPTFATANGWMVTEYKSSKDKYVTVSSTGVVTAVAEGKAKITVKTNGKKATVKIKVVDPYKPEEIAITQGKELTLTVGQTVRLGTALTPSTARATLEWKSSKDKYVTVDGSGNVRAVSEGSAKITVKTQNKKKATIKIKVVDPYKPDSIAIAQGKEITLEMGQSIRLNAVLTPSTARTTLEWKSSKDKVATVDGSGNVRAVVEGSAKITVKTANGKKATIKVKVEGPEVLDLARYFGRDINILAQKLGLPVSIVGWLQFAQCTDAGLVVQALDTDENNAHVVDFIVIENPCAYSFAGIQIGMDFKTARKLARKFAKSLNYSIFDEAGDENYYYFGVELKNAYNGTVVECMDMSILAENGIVYHIDVATNGIHD